MIKITGYRPIDAATQPPYDAPAYGSTHHRHPKQALVALPHTVTEVSAPRFRSSWYLAHIDMTKENGREAIGERIIVAGTLRDEDGRSVPDAMIEIWQANATGRYAHERDQHDAPLDPNFRGVGRVFTDTEGRYSITTIRPGAYPWRNHDNAWRPTHIHFGLHGAGVAQRLITQMYFPGDPLLPIDPIFMATSDAAARERLVAQFDLAITQPEWALGYRFDITLRGHLATLFEDGSDH